MIQNRDNLPAEIQQWLDNNSQELLLYPNHYLLITIPRGVVLAAESKEEWIQKVAEMSRKTEQFSEEEMKQPCFMIITNTPDASKRGQA